MAKPAKGRQPFETRFDEHQGTAFAQAFSMLSDDYLLRLSEIQIYLVLHVAADRVRDINGTWRCFTTQIR